MLYQYLFPLSDQIPLFNLFKYITFRTGGAIFTAWVICLVIGPSMINWLRVKQDGASNIREYTPENHLEKSGTPSMGGFMILISMSLSTLLWSDLDNIYVWIALLVTLGFGLIGFLDDYLKLTKRGGLAGRFKLLGQVLISITASILITNHSPFELANILTVPFFKNIVIDLGLFFIPFAMLVMVGSSNAVNLTDGLDGLAIMPVVIASAVFGIITYLVGHSVYAQYLQLPYIAGTGELAIFAGAIIGAGLGFLWFNAPPAAVFMGDTGSLALGGALGVMAVITKHEIVLAIVGGVFVVETLSVIIQVVSFRLTGKRIFLMAPIHHHYEKKGWSESSIVIRFWIISFMLALIGLATLKLR